MTQYLGLLLLLVGMGAFFGLWLMMINNRSKIIESQVVPPEPGSPLGTLNRTSDYSLAPKLHSVSHAGQQKAAATSDIRKPGVSTSEAKNQHMVEEAPVELDDETATTHLEIAHQFFDMGDFEGAIDMCQLVIENQSASAVQLESANKLKSSCE